VVRYDQVPTIAFQQRSVSSWFSVTTMKLTSLVRLEIRSPIQAEVRLTQNRELDGEIVAYFVAR
jgi:hypothetical protein